MLVQKASVSSSITVCISPLRCLWETLHAARDLQTLKRCRREVSTALELPEEELDLSMGMSGDFEQAVSISILVPSSSMMEEHSLVFDNDGSKGSTRHPGVCLDPVEPSLVGVR